jgi:acetyl esterase/lipase
MKLKRSILSAIVLFAASVGLHAAGGESGAIHFDAVYRTTPQGPLKLDLHYPESPKPVTKYPLVLFTHGGGWVAGSKTIGDHGVEVRGGKRPH